MRNRELATYRRRVAPVARGRVLEIGIGSGFNLPFYGSEVTEVIGLDPSSSLLAMAERQANEGRMLVTMLQGSAEAIPLEDASIDTVLTTWTLCSIPNAHAALNEVRRVLKPAGGWCSSSTARHQISLSPAGRTGSRLCGGRSPAGAILVALSPPSLRTLALR
jgi:ubiquinone/menaquinone biosynthesis C-methylase UbiE